MLEYVGDPGGIRRIRLEADGENIIRVLSSYMKILRPSLLMMQLKCRKLELRHMFCTIQDEAV